MLFSPLSVFSTAVAALLLSSWTGASASSVGTHVVVARQEPSATPVTTCVYTWSCDSTEGYSTGNAAGPQKNALRCVRAADASTGTNSSSCYYPTAGGNSVTGVSSQVDYSSSAVVSSTYNSTVPCPETAIRSSTENSCTTTSARRRGVPISPAWAVQRQAVIRKSDGGKREVVARAKTTAGERVWRGRR